MAEEEPKNSIPYISKLNENFTSIGQVKSYHPKSPIYLAQLTYQILKNNGFQLLGRKRSLTNNEQTKIQKQVLVKSD